MNDKEDNGKSDGGIQINKDGLNCLPCRCRRNTLHKETKTTTNQHNEVVVSVIEDRSSFRIGRGVTPDTQNIFKTNEIAIQSGDVSIADTGWGQTGRKITPEEAEDRIEKLEKQVEELKSFQRMNSMD